MGRISGAGDPGTGASSADLVRPKKQARTGSARSGDSSSSTAPQINIKQRIVLSNEQKEVLNMVVKEGKSLFFTGSAGMFKPSFFLGAHLPRLVITL